MTIDEPGNLSGSSHKGRGETSDLRFLVSRARLVNEYSRDQFDYDFTSLLISFLVTNTEISNWFKTYIKDRGVDYERILGYKGIDEERLEEIQKRLLKTIDSVNIHNNLTRSAEAIIEFASHLLQVTRQFENEPLDVRHIMGAFIYHPRAHREQLHEWKFNFEDWSNSFLEQISEFYSLEIIGWITIHILSFGSVPKLEFAGIEYPDDLRGSEQDGKDRTLNFADISKINHLIRKSDSNDLMKAIYNIMNNDLEIRNNKYGMDCLRELYSDESLLPTNLRLPIHESELDRPTINQQYRAIVLGEYERLYSDATRDFIEKKVSYPEYLRKVKEYTRFANELWI